MATSGYSATPLPKKLGIKEGHAVAVLGDPGQRANLVQPRHGAWPYYEEPEWDREIAARWRAPRVRSGCWMRCRRG